MAKPFEDWMIPLIKAMLIREDDQSDIAACFLINGGRIAEIHNSMMAIARKEHSAKPEQFLELIEQYFPSLTKIELNARAARPGWDAWGNEAPAEAAE